MGDNYFTFVAGTCRGQSSGCPAPLRLRNPPPSAHDITRRLVEPGKVRGTSLSVESGHRQVWVLIQCQNGITWAFDWELPLIKEIAGTHSTRGAPAHPKWGCHLFQSSGPPLSVVRSVNGSKSPNLHFIEAASFPDNQASTSTSAEAGH